MPPYTDKLAPRRQRKLLALDGGGIRGMISIEVLARIERLLQRALGRDDTFVLSDYFDYIAGTSTGAIIATCLALGMRVDEIREFYEESGEAMFSPAGFLRRKVRHKFEHKPLAEKLKEVVGDATTLGSPRLQTLLMIVLRNATTDSPWPVSNNPDAKYSRRGTVGCDLELPLWQLVRASTAAPTFFSPEEIRVGPKRFVFVDGGITTYNNPAFQLFMMATVEPYNLKWEASEKTMLLVSIGTGTAAEANENLKLGQMNVLYNAKSIPSALMFAALNEQDFLCRAFGRCLAGDKIDSEIGDMIGACGPVNPKLFTYVRYNAELTRKGLDALQLTGIEPTAVQRLDSTKAIGDLQRIGRAVGARKVHETHFEGFLGVTRVVALAGRRIDAEGATEQRFPLERAGAVHEKIMRLFAGHRRAVLVSSAACGADLLALDVARELGMRFRIVLPFDEKTFRQSSVTDRPGDWGELYDQVCRAAGARNDLIDLELEPNDGQQAYEAATLRILDEASAIGRDEGAPVIAVSVSDGVSRGAGDLTEHFVSLAQQRMEIVRVDTLR